MPEKTSMNTPGTTLLIVEDDAEIRGLVVEMMRREGYTVEEAEDAQGMDAVLSRCRPDLMILDLMLPGEDGLSICRRIRARDQMPILMLTAKSDEIDRVLGLEMGADDYLVKPFGPRELLARVRAILRRGQGMAMTPPTRRFAFAAFVIDLDARQLNREDGRDIALTTAEFDLLACFVQRPRRVLTRDQILEWTHGRSADPFDRTVDMLVSRLRKKLDAVSPDTDLISTVRNGGYLFVAPVKPVS
jgi:DNA-binding response OmpR family regulator